MNLGLTGKACLVTGASRGIGREVARELCAEGASVILVGRDREALERAVESCRQAAPEHDPSPATALLLDVTDSEAGEIMLLTAQERLGRLDVLVNGAGTARRRDIEEVPDRDWIAQYELNVMAPMRAMRTVAPQMAERGWGRIVNICSSAGKRPSAKMPDYSVAKAAELSLSRLFADRYADSGVLINAICPGPTRSEMWTGPGGLAEQAAESPSPEAAEQAMLATGAGRPIGRMAEVEEIAAAIVFLCSERASYVAGAAWGVDGGSVPVII